MLAINPWDRPTAVVLENEKGVSPALTTEMPNNPAEGTHKEDEVSFKDTISHIVLGILTTIFVMLVIFMLLVTALT